MVAVLLGALSLGACVDNNESASVESVRNAKAKQLESVANMNNANADAKKAITAAEVAIKEAEAAYQKAQAELAQAQADQQKILLEKAQAALEAELEAAKINAEAELNNAKAALESAKVKIGESDAVNIVANATITVGSAVFTITYADMHKGLFAIKQTTGGGDGSTKPVKVSYKKKGLIAGMPTMLDWDGCVGTASILLQL